MQKPFFHHYYLTQLLDQQKYKSTYLAHLQGDMKLKVVVKIFDEACMLPNHDYVRSQTAIKAFLALDHPHIVPVLNIGIENRQPYVVTLYMAHGSLRQRLNEWSPKLMHWTAVLNIVSRIADALTYAHERQVVHGNIKPGNIFLDFMGEVLLADFRPSDFIDISKLDYKTDLQTISYMAPEQFIGKSTPSSDQYALACVAYELLTGHAPFFEAQNFSLMWQKHTTEQPLPLTTLVPEVPVAIETAILKAMSKAPEMRYPDIAAFMQALKSELPASIIRKSKTILPSKLELEIPPSSASPEKELHLTRISAFTSSLPIFEDAQSVKKSALTRSVPNPVTPDLVSEEMLASAMSMVLMGKKGSDSGIKETTQQDTVSEETQAPVVLTTSMLKKNLHPAIKDPKQVAVTVPSSVDQSLPETDVMLNAFLTPWEGQRFIRSKRFMIWISALIVMVILCIGGFILAALSTQPHSTALRTAITPQGIHTGQTIAGVFGTPTPNVKARASEAPLTAVATSTIVTSPGVSGGNTSTPVTPTNTVTPVTPTNTVTPVTTTNYAIGAIPHASSSYEGNTYGWSILYVNDGKTTSTPGSMGWSSDSDITVNHTEWIALDLGSVVSVNKVDLYPRNDSGNVGRGFPIAFSIAISADNVNWTTVISRSNYPLPASGAVQSFSFATQSARYVMVQGTTLSQIPNDLNRYRMQFAEIAVY